MASVRALSHYWFRIQSDLFPWLEEQLGELTENEQRLVTLLDLSRIENFTVFSRNLHGRPKKKRDAIARAFVTMDTVPEPPIVVPPRGPVARIKRFSSSAHPTPAGTSSKRYFAPNPVPPTHFLSVASSMFSLVTF